MRYLLLILTIICLGLPTHSFAELYNCPMHPHYTEDRPGACPICGMDLVEVESEPVDHSEHGGRFVVTIAPETIQTMGVRTEKARNTLFGDTIRSYGEVTENIRNNFVVSSRVEGWIKALPYAAVGDEVEEGELLFTLYSPDLLIAQQDYVDDIVEKRFKRAESTAKRLRLLGVEDKGIQVLKERKQSIDYFPFYAQRSGVIHHISVSEGSYIQSGMEIISIQDYSSLWVMVHVAEKDLHFLRKGDKASISFPTIPGLIKIANIDYIFPTIDEKTRTGMVRLVIDNQDGLVKAGAFADVSFETNVEQRLSIPSEALLKHSEGTFVIVALGEGRFEPRQVTTRMHRKGRTEVIFGLNEGDDVVVSSQFLIDSESALKEALRKLTTMPEMEGGHHGHHH